MADDGTKFTDVPTCVQLKTRAHLDSLIIKDGVPKLTRDQTLTGLRFSGKRPSLAKNKRSPLPSKATAHNILGDDGPVPRTSMEKVRFNAHMRQPAVTSNKKRDTLVVPLIREPSKPLGLGTKLDRKHRNKLSKVAYYDTESFASSGSSVRRYLSEGDPAIMRCCYGRQVSESFAEGLATFRRNKKIRQLASRRLSDILHEHEEGQIHEHRSDWKGKLHELKTRQSQLGIIHDTVEGGISHKQIRCFADLLGRGGGITALSKWKTKLYSKQKSKISPLLRFKGYCRLVLICVRLCKYSHKNVQASSSEYLSIIQVTDDYVLNTNDEEGIFFDPTIYRANKEQRLPTDARKILQKLQKRRTGKEIEYLKLVLRSIKAFAEYPNNMQEKLCEVGWYESYESKRAIVRQGEPPHAFYFILSGSVVVTSFDKVSGGTTFLVALHKGMSFGELAVITKKKRQATVSTATFTEFLCISASDFEEIFMSGGVKSITDPDHNSFIRSIPFLKHWPIECLATNPQACMFHFFGRGQVLVRDSNHSDWIYIVKSGSLSVLKKLVEVTPKTSRTEPESDSDDEGKTSHKNRSFGTFGTWNFRVKTKKRRESVEEKEVFKNNIEMEKRLEQTLPGFYNAADRLGLIPYEDIITDHKSRVLHHNRRNSSIVDPNTLVKPSDTPRSVTPENKDAIEPDEDERLVRLPKIRKTSKHVLWGHPEIRGRNPIGKTIARDKEHVPKGAYLAMSKNPKRKVSKKEALQEEIYQKQIEYDKTLLDTKKIGKIGRKTITDELDNKPIQDLTLTEKDIRPMFVQVQVLERGQYFGLTKTVFPEQAETFSVVSNGAECIMISKKFFMEKATETTMHHLRQVETLLPPEEELQENLQHFVDWKAHRARVYRRLVSNKHSRTARHNQFPPQFGGQYCFRTGPTIRID